MNTEEIYNILRETFHSKSGIYLNKIDAMEIALIIRDRSIDSTNNPPKLSSDFKREEHPYSADYQAKKKEKNNL
jgi:hypothetical protein